MDFEYEVRDLVTAYQVRDLVTAYQVRDLVTAYLAEISDDNLVDLVCLPSLIKDITSNQGNSREYCQ